MNADLKRVREGAVEDASSPAKKRAIGLASPPAASSDDSGIEDWMRVVEVRRKEAIYRQMLEYRRYYEEEARKVEALEAQRRAHEAAVQAVELCFSQVVKTVLGLVGGAELPPDDQAALEPILDASTVGPSLNAALSKRVPIAKQLVQRLTDAASKSGARPDAVELQRRYSQLQVETDALKTGRQSLEAQISEIRESRDRYKRDLDRAKKALDRQRMEHDKAEAEWRQNGAQEVGTAVKRSNGSGHATPNGKAEEDVKPAVQANSTNANLPEADSADADALAASRLRELERLREEQVTLTQEVDRLRQLAYHPSENALRESPFFQVYLHQMSNLQARATTYQQRFEAAEEKLDQLRNGNLEFRDAIQAEARAEIDALRAQVVKQNSDLARLRGQRDEISDELTERKAKDQHKATWGQEMEELANMRSQRLVFLESEVRRLKGRLGAESGSKRYLDFLKGDGGIDRDYVKDLETRLADAEGALSASRGAENANPSIELEKLQRRLADFERILGSDPQVAQDASQLAQKLQESEQEMSKLRLQLSEADAATNALYTEVEGISKLWEGLDRTLSTKVFELKDGEQRMARLFTEKAKADNKYFQAMRAKDAIDAECKTAQRSVDKQLKLIEKAREVERALSVQLSNQEKGMTSLKNETMGLQSALATVDAEKNQLDLRLRQALTALNDASATSKQRVAEAAADRAEKIKAQEELEAAERQVKKLKERQALLGSAASSGAAGDSQMKDERDKLLKILRCSCCEQNFKQQVIVKCMHTFCKQCIDDRVNTRQRKCPACGIGFAKEDVQTLYWQ